MTPTERMLWEHLRKKSVDGFKFLRQHPLFVMNQGVKKFYIPDFYCPKVHLVVELDGPIHNLQKEFDLERAEILELHGYVVMRFRNKDVTESLEKILKKIEQTLRELSISREPN